MKKIALIGLVVVILAVTGVYLFNKKPADVRRMKAEFNLTSEELVNIYHDEKIGNEMLLDKIIIVSGEVISIEKTNGNMAVFLRSSDPLTGVTCSFYPEESKSLQRVSVGDHVSIKGVCTGNLMDVVLNQCSLTK